MGGPGRTPIRLRRPFLIGPIVHGRFVDVVSPAQTRFRTFAAIQSSTVVRRLALTASAHPALLTPDRRGCRAPGLPSAVGVSDSLSRLGEVLSSDHLGDSERRTCSSAAPRRTLTPSSQWLDLCAIARIEHPRAVAQDIGIGIIVEICRLPMALPTSWGRRMTTDSPSLPRAYRNQKVEAVGAFLHVLLQRWPARRHRSRRRSISNDRMAAPQEGRFALDHRLVDPCRGDAGENVGKSGRFDRLTESVRSKAIDRSGTCP